MAIWLADNIFPPWLIHNTFRTDKALDSLDVPVLILHGKKDRVIPIAHARRLHQIAARSKLVEFDAGHNDLSARGRSSKYWDIIRTFLRDQNAARKIEK